MKHFIFVDIHLCCPHLLCVHTLWCLWCSFFEFVVLVVFMFSGASEVHYVWCCGVCGPQVLWYLCFKFGVFLVFNFVVLEVFISYGFLLFVFIIAVVFITCGLCGVSHLHYMWCCIVASIYVGFAVFKLSCSYSNGLFGFGGVHLVTFILIEVLCVGICGVHLVVFIWGCGTMILPWSHIGTTMILPLSNHDMPVFYHDCPMIYYHDFALFLPWQYHSLIWVFSWCYHELLYHLRAKYHVFEIFWEKQLVEHEIYSSFTGTI